MRLLLVMIVLLAVAGTAMAVQLSGPAGKAILASLTGNNSLNTSNETQSGLAGWGSDSHNLTMDSGNVAANESGIHSLNNESAMETPTQAADQSAAV
jgi:hypothetical protein